ncbi:MAG: microcin transport system permease protein [Methylobacteriaceae bacterium]|nr:microcin transport system permease protein [Methylobacteriaceae bacterium]
MREEMAAAARENLVPALPRAGLLQLRPLNQRRLDNFQRNRRGYYSFWIFAVMFVVSLFAEFIANDKPIIASYKGELLFPIFRNYPEEKFGGFLAQTDYRDPMISGEIAANGWAIWPPIRYSYNTHNLEMPLPAPSPPTWMLSEAQCQKAAARKLKPGEPNRGCGGIEWNWLGTDDQGRDVVARLLYGFRISVLFGLILASISSVIGVTAGAVQGYFGGWTDLLFQRFIEIWSSLPHLYL